MVTIAEYRKKGDKVSSSEWNAFIDNFKELDERLASQEKRVQYGLVENIDTSKSGIRNGNVNFAYSFDKIPVVTLALENLDEGVQVKPPWIANRSINGFTWNLFVLVPKRETNCNLLWLAVE
jgi:hypothetical protein